MISFPALYSLRSASDSVRVIPQVSLADSVINQLPTGDSHAGGDDVRFDRTIGGLARRREYDRMRACESLPPERGLPQT